MNILKILLAILLAGSLAMPAAAQIVVWDNGPYAVSLGEDISNSAVADDFVFNAPTSFNGIRFWAENSNVLFTFFSGTVGWAVHTNGGGNVPGAILHSGATNAITLTLTGSSVGDANIWQLDFSIPEINLAAGTYWLQLRENAIGSPWDGEILTINWVPRDGGPLGFSSRQDSNEQNPAGWPTNLGADRAFVLVSNVPEPATLLLGAVGLGGAVWTGWKKRRRRTG